MNIIGFISSIFKPAADLVDNLHTSKEEKLELRNKMIDLQNVLAIKVLEYESKIMEIRGDIIKTEATGQSFLQRNWRPITMLTFLVLVVCDSFGLLTFRLAQDAWTLLQIGLGGYVVGRSVEKTASKIMGKNR